jgi:hypothetical protein
MQWQAFEAAQHKIVTRGEADTKTNATFAATSVSRKRLVVW